MKDKNTIENEISAAEHALAAHPATFIAAAAGIIVFAAIVATALFFITIRGAEQTMVPNVERKELTEALLELQAKELYPRIQLRFSNTARDAGLILEQDPRPGTIVKAGRRIRLVVSQGAVVSAVDNFTGRNIEEVRMDLQALFASAGTPLLTLREPLMYQYSDREPGTIIEQSPRAGTSISGPTVLELVVSRGMETGMREVPALLGLESAAALDKLNQSNVRFLFSIAPARDRDRPETVVSQTPASGAQLSESAVVMVTVAAPPNLAGNEVYGLFSYDIPQNPYPLPVSLESQTPDGRRRTLAATIHSGGDFSFPYRLPKGSVLVLSLLSREIHRETVN
jgi:beta-lactam-binding protein with PASTA domain